MDSLEATKNKLKVQALLEKISSLENHTADLRVELTLAQNLVSDLRQEITTLKESLESRVPETQEDADSES